MQAGIASYDSKQILRAEIIQCAHRKTEMVLFCVLNMLKEYVFKDTGEELLFFKQILPLFFAEEEYYSLVWQAALKKTAVPDISLFWLNELKRLDKFLTANKQFCSDFENSSDDFDIEHFRRMSTTRGDEILGAWTAQQRYHEYVKQQLWEIAIVTK